MFCQLVKLPAPSLNIKIRPFPPQGATPYKVDTLRISLSPSLSKSTICAAVPKAEFLNSPSLDSLSSVNTPVPSLRSIKSLAVPPAAFTL